MLKSRENKTKMGHKNWYLEKIDRIVKPIKTSTKERRMVMPIACIKMEKRITMKSTEFRRARLFTLKTTLKN